MEIFKILILLLILIAVGFIFFFLFKSKNFVKLMFLNMLLGVITLIILKLTSKFTGVEIWINQYTMSSALIFGIPAVIGFIILKLIFI